jgi:ferredoxin-NADP reductase
MTAPQKNRCRVCQIINHGDHVYTIDLESERILPRFKPGQFLHLALDDYDPSGFWPESRVFSIANSPLQRNSIRISYSVKGRYTSRMEYEIKEGNYVWIKMPYGEFIIPNEVSDVVLLAGGTGITAFTAFLGKLSPDSQFMVYLCYGVRNEKLFMYREFIDKRCHEIPNLKVFYFVETDKISSSELSGRLSVKKIWQSIRNPDNSIFYISGPPMMIQSVTNDLKMLGLSSESIKTDAWE